ncbi:MAG: SDR family NAD(P)-dependent oxidoreductase [Planctomycetes bacterium]|nr:SDR family NAD(P)-dependent oxidoreductase [Planctomycetota bacterium]
MERPFAGKRILLTGASSGIGRALAHELACHGCELFLAGRDALRLAETAAAVRAAGGRARACSIELGESGAGERLVDRALAEMGALDVLVNNAAYGVTANLADVPGEEFERLFAVNLFAIVAATRRALPALRRVRGLVVNVGSVVGRRGLPTIGAYCMTKAALGSFSEALRAEEARHGVHVLQVEPGMTATRFGENRRIYGDHPRHYRSAFTLSAEVVARRIVHAMARRRDRLVLGLPGRLMVLVNGLAPWLMNRLLARKTS